VYTGYGGSGGTGPRVSAGTVDPARTTENPPRRARAEGRGHREELQVFNDIGPFELVTIVVLAVLVFGPDKLPKVIQDTMRTIRKIREFSESAKQDIRNELGPEFKDFEFEDLNPKTFIRKQLENDELGLKEIRNGFDLKKEMAEVAEAVHSADTDPAGPSGAAVDMRKKPELLKKDTPQERPPFDADAT
jgi:sec-independent protein translocase protein TatB